jgi:predicted transcriptional regulator of viral defense system
MSDAARKTGKYGPLNGQHGVVELAARQHGVVSLDQLETVGLTASAVRKRAGQGRLHRVHHAVYSIAPPELLNLRGRFMAAVLACGPGAVLSHRSAAHLHGLRRTERQGIDVTVPGRRHPKHTGIDTHTSTTLTPADTTIVDGIPCTTIARTLLDLGEVVNTRQVERALEQGDTMEIIDLRAVDDQLQRNGKRKAANRLRQALASLHPDAAPSESRFEEDLLALCRRIDVPEPRRQFWITPDDGEPAVRADFAWPQHKLIVETDGGAHRTRHRFEADRRKDQRLALLGWRVIRLTWRQLNEEPRRIERLLLDLLRPA